MKRADLLAGLRLAVWLAERDKERLAKAENPAKQEALRRRMEQWHTLQEEIRDRLDKAQNPGPSENVKGRLS